MNKAEKTEDQEKLEGKMTIQFLNTDLGSSPVVGNVYEGKVSVLNTATAERFIEHGHAKQVPHGTKSLEKVDAVEGDDDDEEELENEPSLEDNTKAELQGILNSIEVEFKPKDSKAVLIKAVEDNKEALIEVAEDLGIEVPEDAETAAIITLIDAETAE